MVPVATEISFDEPIREFGPEYDSLPRDEKGRVIAAIEGAHLPTVVEQRDDDRITQRFISQRTIVGHRSSRRGRRRKRVYSQARCECGHRAMQHFEGGGHCMVGEDIGIACGCTVFLTGSLQDARVTARVSRATKEILDGEEYSAGAVLESIGSVMATYGLTFGDVLTRLERALGLE